MVTMTLMVLVCRTYTIALSGLPQNTSWLQQNGKCFLFGGKPWRKPIEWGFYYRYIRKITVAWIQLQAKWRQNTSAFRDSQPIYTVQPNVHYKELDQCAVHLPTHVSTFFVFIFLRTWTRDKGDDIYRQRRRKNFRSLFCVCIRMVHLTNIGKPNNTCNSLSSKKYLKQ